MSRLYFSESGRVLPTLGEELSNWRRARKRLRLPRTEREARVYVLARSGHGCRCPLLIRVNGSAAIRVEPRQPGFYRWHTVSIPASTLSEGVNTLDLWCEAPTMGCWTLAVEYASDGKSETSRDAGRSFSSGALGVHSIARGEYVVRIRIAEGRDPRPPRVRFEGESNPNGLHRMRSFLPADFKSDSGPAPARLREVSSWLSRRWPYLTTREGRVHAPWDPPTIDEWTQSGRKPAGEPPVIWCIHFSMSFVLCCAAIGIPARCAVICEENTVNGHSIAEVWLADIERWIVVDPTFDVTFASGNVPLSIEEIREHPDNLSSLVRAGDGLERRLDDARLRAFWRESYLTGRCFAHRSVFTRCDCLSHPELSPPAHGSVSFCETNLVWERESRNSEFAMFPYAGSPRYFAAAPSTPRVPYSPP